MRQRRKGVPVAQQTAGAGVRPRKRRQKPYANPADVLLALSAPESHCILPLCSVNPSSDDVLLRR